MTARHALKPAVRGPSATCSDRSRLAVRIEPVFAGHILTTEIHHPVHWGGRVVPVRVGKPWRRGKRGSGTSRCQAGAAAGHGRWSGTGSGRARALAGHGRMARGQRRGTQADARHGRMARTADAAGLAAGGGLCQLVDEQRRVDRADPRREVIPGPGPEPVHGVQLPALAERHAVVAGDDVHDAGQVLG